MTDCRSSIKYEIYQGEVKWGYSIHNTSRTTGKLTFFEILLGWRHNEHDGVSNHQPHDCLINRLFKAQTKENQSSASLDFVRGIHRWPVNSPHKGAVTRKMLPFDNVIMLYHKTPNHKRVCWVPFAVVILSAIIYFIRIIHHEFQSCDTEIVWYTSFTNKVIPKNNGKIDIIYYIIVYRIHM